MDLQLTYESQDVRILGTPDRPVWVAEDLRKVLGHRDQANLTRILDADEKGTHIVSTLGGPQEMATITEPGLYKLLARSRKPVAKRFNRWLFHEVLPCIRKHGCYPAPKVRQGNTSIVPNDTKRQQLLAAYLESLDADIEDHERRITNTELDVDAWWKSQKPKRKPIAHEAKVRDKWAASMEGAMTEVDTRYGRIDIYQPAAWVVEVKSETDRNDAYKVSAYQRHDPKCRKAVVLFCYPGRKAMSPAARREATLPFNNEGITVWWDEDPSTDYNQPSVQLTLF